MNRYSAIMLAADHIERHPESFDFFEVGKPSCGTPGCALGWIGAFAGIASRSWHYVRGVAEYLGVSDMEFYDRMGLLSPDIEGVSWTESAINCARCLRLYAKKYHSYDAAQLATNVAQIATPGATYSGEDSARTDPESSRPRELQEEAA